MKDNYVKVGFVQEVKEREFETETLWCMSVGDNFIVDNIPFIAKRISLGDVIRAEFDKDDKQYYFDDFVLSSGNTTLRVFFYDDSLIESIRQKLNELGCESEVLLARSIVAVNVPKEVDYSPIKLFLDEGEKKDLWAYEESCLEHDY